MSTNMITLNQKKAIWAFSKDKGFKPEEVYDLIYTVSHKDHMSDLTSTEASQVIYRIKSSQYGKTDLYTERITDDRLADIYILAATVNWNILKLGQFISNCYNVCDIRKLSSKDSEDLIEILVNIKQNKNYAYKKKANIL